MLMNGDIWKPMLPRVTLCEQCLCICNELIDVLGDGDFRVNGMPRALDNSDIISFNEAED